MVDQDILQEFLAESREHLGTVEEDILALEKKPGDAETINHLFRALHTIKGGTSFLGLTNVTALAHALENVVGKIRSAELVPDAQVVEALLRGADRLEFLVEHHDDDSLHGKEEIAILEGAFGPSATASVSGQKPETDKRSRKAAGGSDEAAREDGEQERARSSQEQDDKPSHAGGVSADPGDPGSRKDPKSRPSPESGADSTVRISVALLDRMMNLASELVLVRNQNMQAIDARDFEQLTFLSQRLNVVTSDLQTSVMQTRMRPVSQVFQKFTRIVRDLARTVNKEVDLEIIGTDVELDKNIIEAIGDPLTHLLRNAVDHGIESKADRTARGKSVRGHVLLKAEHRAGQVNIVIHDDGKGMNPAELIKAALKKGMISKAQAETMSDRDAYNLTFLPGFTMAESVTHLSGRGVGMDVVKDAFGKFGGTVDIDSHIGKGTTFTIRLPLTVAIVPALIVSSADVCFAIPQVNIKEIVWLRGEEVYKNLRIADEREVFRLRGKLLPVLRLTDLMGLTPRYVDRQVSAPVEDPRAQRPDRRQSRSDDVPFERRRGPRDRRVSPSNSVFIVVINLDEEQYALLVDSIVDTEEIVVKELHDQLKPCGAFVGTTVMGDGRIALILDVADLARVGELGFHQSDTSMLTTRSSSEAKYTLLLFDVGGKQHYAAPLFNIKRVEEVTADSIQKIKNKEYMTFRNEVIPLVRVGQALGQTEPDDSGDVLHVIIPKSEKPFGILVGNIRDTMEVNQKLDSETISQDGIVGSILIDGKLTLVLDLFRIIELADPGWNAVAHAQKLSVPKLLLVEDSKFFASILIPPLKSNGVEIVHAQNGQEALEQLAAGSFDSVVSDIEMPLMGGLELARRVRGKPEFASLPMVAMSSMSDPTIETKALAAGFDVFKSKLDHSLLIEEILQRLPKRAPR